MSSMNLDECFKLFDLPMTATLSQLDDRYYEYMMRAIARRRTDPLYSSSRKKELDQAYIPLLSHFISKSGAYSSLNGSPPAKYSLRDLATKTQDEAVQQVLGRDSTTALGLEGKVKEKDDTIVQSIKSVHDSPTTFYLCAARGNIIDIPDRSVIIHAVNCLGTWGDGFANLLKQQLPRAFLAYRSHCLSAESVTSLAGTNLLIPPRPGDFRHQLWVACLFTSVGYGKRIPDRVNPGKDDVPTILRYTDKALMDLRQDLASAQQRVVTGGPSIGNLYSPRFNSGLFGVPWNDTEQLIEKSFASYQGSWTVIILP